MNGFADQGLDEGAFGEKKGLSEGLRTFDAFRELLSSSFTCPPSPPGLDRRLNKHCATSED